MSNSAYSTPGLPEVSRMGCWGLHPSWLQRFSSAPYFLVALCIFTGFQAMIESGLIPVVITSIEKRYSLNSKESGFIISFFDAVTAVAVIIVTHYGHNFHKPRLLSRGMLLVALGCLFFVLPQFIGGLYSPSGNLTGSEVCGKIYGAETCSSNPQGYYAFFIVGQFFIALGTAPLYTLGITFLDDNVAPNKSPMFVGIFYMFSAIGPAIGFVLGGAFLSFWVDPGQTSTLNPDSSGWVGAWWAGFLVAGGMSFLFSPFMMSFPKALPGTQWIRDLRGKKEPSEVSADEKSTQFLVNIKSLLRNKPFLFTQLGSATESLVIVGIGAFLPKAVETQFLLSASNASFLTGVSVIIGAAGGTFVGGIISRTWSPKYCTRMTAIFAFVSLCLSFCTLIHCVPIELIGVTTPYLPGGTPGSFCSTSCNCTKLMYRPVCSPAGQTFSTVCDAGCAVALSVSDFTNCSCASSLADVLSDGRCRNGCTLLPLFLFLLLALMVFTFLNQVPTTTVTLRVVQEHERSLGMGLSSTIYRVLGAIPGPLIVGTVLDNTCILWETKCDGSTGSCWEYNSRSMSIAICIALVSFKTCSAIFFTLAWYTCPHDPSGGYFVVNKQATNTLELSLEPPENDDYNLLSATPLQETDGIDEDLDLPVESHV